MNLLAATLLAAHWHLLVVHADGTVQDSPLSSSERMCNEAASLTLYGRTIAQKAQDDADAARRAAEVGAASKRAEAAYHRTHPCRSNARSDYDIRTFPHLCPLRDGGALTYNAHWQFIDQIYGGSRGFGVVGDDYGNPHPDQSGSPITHAVCFKGDRQ